MSYRFQYIAYVRADNIIASHRLPVATGWSDSPDDKRIIEMLTVFMAELPENMKGDRQSVDVYEVTDGRDNMLTRAVPTVTHSSMAYQ